MIHDGETFSPKICQKQAMQLYKLPFESYHQPQVRNFKVLGIERVLKKSLDRSYFCRKMGQ